MAMGGGVRQRIREGEKETKPTRYYSGKQEKQVAKTLNGVVTPNSGATPWAPGDVVAGKFLVECKTKTTHAESISIRKDWIIKNTEEAVFRGLPYSLLVFNFGPNEDNYYIINESLMIDFIDYMNNKKDNL